MISQAGSPPSSSQAHLARPGKAAPREGWRHFTTVHARGPAVLDAMLDLCAAASHDAPQGEVLADLAERITRLLGVDVCSIYLRETAAGVPVASGGDEDVLVLAATSGRPGRALWHERVRVGEGLTGLAAECLRPVVGTAPPTDAPGPHVAALDEAHAPALCAVPLIDGGHAIGVLVVERRKPHTFGRREVVMVAAMAPAVLWALERTRARLPGEPGEERTGRRRPVEITLRGTASAPGRGLGVVAVQRAPMVSHAGRASDVASEQERLEHAFNLVSAAVAVLAQWATERLAALPGAAASAARSRLWAIRSVLDDQRLRERAREHIAAGASAEAAVERVAREYARRLGSSSEEALRERGIELEGLCDRVLEALGEGAVTPLAPGRVHVGSRLTVFEAIELAHGHGVGAALSTPAEASPGASVARALGLPVVTDLRSLFRWTSEGDRALVDGDRGMVLLNPWRSDVAAHRRARR